MLRAVISPLALKTRIILSRIDSEPVNVSFNADMRSGTMAITGNAVSLATGSKNIINSDRRSCDVIATFREPADICVCCVMFS